MKPTKDIPITMLDNGGSPVFKNDFFERFTLRKAARPLQLTDRISKDYLFPTFYGDVTCAIAIFLCSYNKAEVLVAERLHPKIKPVRISRGRAIIAFSCYEYKNVMNVPPYNEIAMAVPVMVNAAFRPPLLPMIMKFSRFGYYIAGMPVTSRENQIRGNRIWGLPKVTQRIDIEKKGSDCVTTAYENSGEPYLTLRVPVNGTAAEFDETSSLYSRLDGKLLRSETNFRAVFNVNKRMDLLFRKGVKPDRACIEIGRGGSAKLLRDLEIEEQPFQTRYAEHMSSCFDLPSEKTQNWFEKLNG
ncbi:MAG TPA: acetoacetate decarboxylase family protein [Spirochaetota bacterium]|nr:acetoacetate decarboxylase family protein [Spirochaetota bacterium]HPC42848.1 acetoacetate decarboxylase family protein [Spirochaetota bacterium]HPL16773.1 acetoacetate decarboxylase family protein [Spirochaetota bacterium]HQF07120.1 acetoacetate decarboxylase family protein [Spirochaetota bacterium]HQH95857.1 acetoacetate decarboxylase family protein [Spirochaetota bacterium]